MNVDRRRVEMALHADTVENRLRENTVPVFFRGDVVDVIQESLVDQIVKLLRRIELGGGGWITADDPVDRGGARLISAGDCVVDPLATGLVVRDGKLPNRGRLAARGPPVNHVSLERFRMRDDAIQRQCRNYASQDHSVAVHSVSSRLSARVSSRNTNQLHPVLHRCCVVLIVFIALARCDLPGISTPAPRCA
ncbi:hypothetical protein OKW29_002041 [Paraburkholderia sp. CI3]